MQGRISGFHVGVGANAMGRVLAILLLATDPLTNRKNLYMLLGRPLHWGQTSPSSVTDIWRWPLQRSVPILLECILVIIIYVVFLLSGPYT